MKDNIIGILNQLKSNMQNYEHHSSRETMTPHEKVLDILEYDYMRFFNHDDWLAALRMELTEAEAELWCHYPEYTIKEQGITIEEVKAKLPPAIAAQAETLTQQLIQKKFLFDYGGRYVTTYLLGLLFEVMTNYNDSPLHKACVAWFNEISYNSEESKMLRSPFPAHRVIPHEATLTGDAKYGRIPMNVDIPDTRQVLDIDKASQMLARCRRYAVADCICRKSKDYAKVRQCDYPLEVCLLFDEDADGAIALGQAREISYEDALEIIKKCRDQGLVQVISNAEHPLSVCNCCECCCVCLLTMNRNESAMAEPSRFIVDVARSADCIKCGMCMKACPSNAIDVKDTYIQAITSKCIGCGMCVSKCPKAVLKMMPKPGAPVKLERESMRRTYL